MPKQPQKIVDEISQGGLVKTQLALAILVYTAAIVCQKSLTVDVGKP
jgi:hypothetical protein